MFGRRTIGSGHRCSGASRIESGAGRIQSIAESSRDARAWQSGAATANLARYLKTTLAEEAQKHYQFKTAKQPVPLSTQQLLQGLPLNVDIGWLSPKKLLDLLEAATQASTLNAESSRTKLTALAPALKSELDPVRAIEQIVRNTTDYGFKTVLVRTIQNVTRKIASVATLARLKQNFDQAPDRESKEKYLDQLCTWPSMQVIPLLLTLQETVGARTRGPHFHIAIRATFHHLMGGLDCLVERTGATNARRSERV